MVAVLAITTLMFDMFEREPNTQETTRRKERLRKKKPSFFYIHSHLRSMFIITQILLHFTVQLFYEKKRRRDGFGFSATLEEKFTGRTAAWLWAVCIKNTLFIIRLILPWANRNQFNSIFPGDCVNCKGEHRHIRTDVRTGAYQVKWLWRKIQTRLFSCMYQKLYQDPEPYLSRSWGLSIRWGVVPILSTI